MFHQDQLVSTFSPDNGSIYLDTNDLEADYMVAKRSHAEYSDDADENLSLGAIATKQA